jgi:hypothetical protein
VAFAFIAAAAVAQSVAVTPRGVAVAHDGVLDLYDERTLQRISRTNGVQYAGEIVANTTCDPRPATCDVAVLDPLHNKARLNDATITTHETPIAGAFVDHQLFVLERDSRTLSRGGDSIRTGAYPQFLRAANKKLYVYSAIEGLLQEIGASPFALVRELHIAKFATDLEVDDTTAYLTYPDKGLVRVIDLDKMEDLGGARVGSWPIDLTLAGGNNVLTGRLLAIADPLAQRVWSMEGHQSTAAAFGRGALRGLLGMGRFGRKNPELATGPDRIVARGTRWMAYDSSTGTLYDIAHSSVNVLARGVAPRAFALGDGVVYLWRNGTLVAQKVD